MPREKDEPVGLDRPSLRAVPLEFEGGRRAPLAAASIGWRYWLLAGLAALGLWIAGAYAAGAGFALIVRACRP